MSKYVLLAEALGDLELIWTHIALDNVEAADRVVEAAYRICAILGQHPELGRERRFSQKGNAGMRSFVMTDFPNYVIFYRVREGAVHGARNVEAIFGDC